MVQTSTKIGDLWLCEFIASDKPHLRIGVWDQDAETTLNVKQLMELRKFITETIIKIKQTK